MPDDNGLRERAKRLFGALEHCVYEYEDMDEIVKALADERKLALALPRPAGDREAMRRFWIAYLWTYLSGFAAAATLFIWFDRGYPPFACSVVAVLGPFFSLRRWLEIVRGKEKA